MGNKNTSRDDGLKDDELRIRCAPHHGEASVHNKHKSGTHNQINAV